ncbi:MAG TPA: hypothetical protein VK891_16855, partial [Euzebyales bacterium]|nr:hypothetical protein [Euzebyales bacterium]
DQRSEAGGLQWTAQQLGSSLGVALIGAIVLTGLSAAFVDEVSRNEDIPADVRQEVGVRVAGGIDFVPTAAVGEASRQAGVDEPTSEALVESYAAAQLLALKAGLLVALALAVGALHYTRDLPSTRPQPDRAPGAARARASVSEPAGGDVPG